MNAKSDQTAHRKPGAGWRHALAVAERAIERVAAHRATGIAITLLYLATITVLAWRNHAMSDGDAESDFFGSYVPQARAFLAGHIAIDAYRGPVYPIVLALVGALPKPEGIGLFEAGIVLSCVAAALAVYLNHRLVARLVSPAVALAGTLLLIANGVFFRYGYTCGTDMFFVAVAMIAVTLTLGTPSPRWVVARAALLGAVLALVYLTRYNGVVFVVGAVVAIAFFDAWSLPPRRRALASLVAVAVFALLITPWGLYCRSQKGSFFYSLNYMNVALSLLPPGSNAEAAAGSRFDNLHGMWDVLRTFPRELLLDMPRRAWHQLDSGLAGVMRWPVGTAVVLGLGSLWVRRPSRREAAYYTFALGFFAALLFVFYSDRFGLFLIPVYAMLAARGVIVVAADVAAGARAWPRRVGAAALIVLFVFSVVACTRYNRRTIAGGDIRVRIMADWFLQHVPFDQQRGRVAARKPAFAYFTGLDPVTLPALGSQRELLDFLHQNDIDYVFFSYVAAATRPKLAYLLDSKRVVPGMELVVTGKAATLWRVDPVVKKPDTSFAPADTTGNTH